MLTGNEQIDVKIPATVGSPGSTETITAQDIANLAGTGSGFSEVSLSVSTDTHVGSLASTNRTYYCTGSLTLTLPAATGSNGVCRVKNIGTGIITVTATSGDVEGASNAQVRADDAIECRSDQSNFYIF